MPAFRKTKNTKTQNSTKISKELIASICQVLKSGAFVETAVIMCGVSKSTFYRWVKESHAAESDLIENGVKINNADRLKITLRDSVAKAMEEATMRDLMNIDKCAMGRQPKYEKYPDNTKIVLTDDRGKVQTDKHGETIYVDVSNQIMTDLKGKPIVTIEAMAADWKASAWRLEKRDPKRWGNTNTFADERKDPLRNADENTDTFQIVFVDPSKENEE